MLLNAGVEDDGNKSAPFLDKGLGVELLSTANFLARGALNPVDVEVVLFLCQADVFANEELLCSCSVEVLFVSQTLSPVFILLRDSKGILKK